MSAPHVAGGIALLLRAFPGLTADECKEVLMMSAAAIPSGNSYGDPLNPLTDDEMKEWGAGKLNIYQAYGHLSGYVDGGGFPYEGNFREAFASNPEAGIPIDVVVSDFNGMGSEFFIQRFTNGVIAYHSDQTEAHWLGCCIWESYSEGETGGVLNYILLGLPVSSQYQDPKDSSLVVVEFEEGKIYCDPASNTAKVVFFRFVDIRPGSCPNPLNVKPYRGDEVDDRDGVLVLSKSSPHDSKPMGVLPVAILGTNDFDVTTVDPSSVTLEGVPALRSAIEDAATPMEEDADICECNSDGADGFPDLTVKFRRSLVVDAVGEVTDGDNIPLRIAGETYDGLFFEGDDCVVIVGARSSESPPASAESVNPPEVHLIGNYPNPFNPSTEIRFSLPISTDVTIEIFNIMGQRVSILLDSRLSAGNHSVKWDGRNSYGDYVATGIYLYRFTAGDFSDIRKMILLK
jgi:hypothetical protein